MTVEEKLRQLEVLKEEVISQLRQEIAAKEKEKQEMIDAYEEEIGVLQNRLYSILGTSAVGSVNNVTLANQVYELLKNRNRWVTAREITAHFKQQFIVPVVLADFIDKGKVLRDKQNYRITPQPAVDAITNPRMVIDRK